MPTPTRTSGLAGETPVARWQVCSSAIATEPGELISRADFRADGWLDAPPRSTALAALLSAGAYPDVLVSTNLRDEVDSEQFTVPWWWRSGFTVSRGGRTWLRLDGVIHRAELWVNGVLVAGPDEVAGAYAVHTFDITHVVAPGRNALALRVYPGDPTTDLSIGWIDWNPTPPDTNMGVWRDAVLLRTGDVRLADPHVHSELSPSLDRADLRIAVDAVNAADEPRTVTITGVIESARMRSTFGRDTTLGPHERRQVVFTPADAACLQIGDPELWWPVGHGGQTLHQLRLTALVDADVSDQTTTTFGIRQVTSRVEPGGGRRFVVNGRPIQILGAGWCPDIFLRHDAQRIADELGYVVELGLNAVRLEGKLENPEFFDIADSLGVMVLPGWECGGKWEAHAGTGGAAWTEADYEIARRSMASEARLLRNHPAVVCFLIGSDFAPEERLADSYIEELTAADWDLPVISSGATEWNNAWAGGPKECASTESRAAGASGMKMWPYDWVPPVYWYGEQCGAAFGFDSECSAGHSIPRLPSLRRMLTPAELERLWQDPQARHYHSAPQSPFDVLTHFHRALAARYGAPRSLHDFCRKAQLINYEMVRAQFEAYRSRWDADRPATGVIYWMLNNAWPGLNWHLYDYYLDPAGAYFGAKKACEPVHVLFDYGSREVVVVNRTPHQAEDLSADIVVRDITGSERGRATWPVAPVGAGGVVRVDKVTVPDDASTTYFLELELCGADGTVVSRNVYWLSSVPDVVDWAASFWQHTPQSQFADLTGLRSLPATSVDVLASHTCGPEGDATTVTVRNVSSTPAVGVHLSLVGAGGSTAIAPLHWDDNNVTLFAGQSATLTARYAGGRARPAPSVRVEGFNVRGYPTG